MYPMIPHISKSLVPAPRKRGALRSGGRALFPLDPAVDVALLAGADRQCARGYVLAYRRSAADIRAFADGDRRNQLRIAADEGAVFDDRLLLPDPVVVAGDRAGSDVYIRPDRRIAEVGEVICLGPGAHGRLLQLHKVPNFGLFPYYR